MGRQWELGSRDSWKIENFMNKILKAWYCSQFQKHLPGSALPDIYWLEEVFWQALGVAFFLRKGSFETHKSRTVLPSYGSIMMLFDLMQKLHGSNFPNKRKEICNKLSVVTQGLKPWGSFSLGDFLLVCRMYVVSPQSTFYQMFSWAIIAKILN